MKELPRSENALWECNRWSSECVLFQIPRMLMKIKDPARPDETKIFSLVINWSWKERESGVRLKEKACVAMEVRKDRRTE